MRNRFFPKDKVPSLITWYGILGSTASISFMLLDEAAVAVTISLSVSIVLITLFMYFSENYLFYQKYFETKDDVNILSNELRNFVKKNYEMENTEAVYFNMLNVISGSLDISARIFTNLTGKKCVASVMLPEEDKKFHTKLYSTNADTERVNNFSDGIEYDKGIIGLAFQYNKIVQWDLKTDDHNFLSIRQNHKEFYNSGMVCPIFVSGEAYALLNIDSKEANLFGHNEKIIGIVFMNIFTSIYEVGTNENMHRDDLLDYESLLEEIEHLAHDYTNDRKAKDILSDIRHILAQE